MVKKYKCTLPDDARACDFDEIKPDMRQKDLTLRFNEFECRRKDFQNTYCKRCGWEESYGEKMKEQARKKYQEVVIHEKLRFYD